MTSSFTSQDKGINYDMQHKYHLAQRTLGITTLSFCWVLLCEWRILDVMLVIILSVGMLNVVKDSVIMTSVKLPGQKRNAKTQREIAMAKRPCKCTLRL